MDCYFLLYLSVFQEQRPVYVWGFMVACHADDNTKTVSSAIIILICNDAVHIIINPKVSNLIVESKMLTL